MQVHVQTVKYSVTITYLYYICVIASFDAEKQKNKNNIFMLKMIYSLLTL